MRVEIPNTITAAISGMVSRGVKAAEVTEDGRLVLTLTDGSTADLGSVVGPQGEKGEKGDTGASGKDGADGKTPVKGTDYFTQSEKQELAAEAAALVNVPVKSVNGKTGAVTVRELPSVAASDNGKFLRVVSGAWAAAEIADANGGSF